MRQLSINGHINYALRQETKSHVITNSSFILEVQFHFLFIIQLFENLSQNFISILSNFEATIMLDIYNRDTTTSQHVATNRMPQKDKALWSSEMHVSSVFIIHKYAVYVPTIGGHDLAALLFL